MLVELTWADALLIAGIAGFAAIVIQEISQRHERERRPQPNTRRK